MKIKVSSINDIKTANDFFSLVMENIDLETESLFEYQFLPNINFYDFFKYLNEKNIINDILLNYYTESFKKLEEDEEEVLDEKIFLLLTGIDVEYLVENDLDSESGITIDTSTKGLSDIHKFWYLVLSYLFENRNKSLEDYELYENYFKTNFSLAKNQKNLEIEEVFIDTKFDFFKKPFSQNNLEKIYNLLDDSINLTDDTIVKSLLENILEILEE